MLGKTIAHYKVLDQLGAGGMGVVYRAHDTRVAAELGIGRAMYRAHATFGKLGGNPVGSKGTADQS